FGGPGNDYATHAIAAMMGRLRHDRAGFGLVHALGWNFTKHALAVYGGQPPPSGWRRVDTTAIQTSVAAQSHPVVAPEPSGAGRRETSPAAQGAGGGAGRGAATGPLDAGGRFTAKRRGDRALLGAAGREEQVGGTGRVTTADGVTTFDPG